MPQLQMGHLEQPCVSTYFIKCCLLAIYFIYVNTRERSGAYFKANIFAWTQACDLALRLYFRGNDINFPSFEIEQVHFLIFTVFFIFAENCLCANIAKIKLPWKLPSAFRNAKLLYCQWNDSMLTMSHIGQLFRGY